MTRFYLIRHAERDTPDSIVPGVAPGIHLTERGRAHAERIAEYFAEVPLDRICSSPQERALETAAPLARLKQLQVEISPAFGEIDFGHWTKQSVASLEPDPRWREFNRFRSGTRIPGGETALQVQLRFVDELIRLRDAAPGQQIACVSHADPIRLALGYFLGMPIDFFERLEIAFGSIGILELAPWGPRIVRVNEVPR